jgi:hypothetical protein
MLNMPTKRQTMLPSEEDFDPWHGRLDAQVAWKRFGGLTIDEASALFRENPVVYQESFMFMGGKAFAYYFPVIEDYLRNVPNGDHEWDHESWIIAHDIRNQFERENFTHVRHLASRVIELAVFVQENIRRFGATEKERAKVAKAWTDLLNLVKSLA